MRSSRHVPVIALCLGVFRQSVLAQQAPIPIRPLGAIIATSAEAFGTITSIRVLGDGHVLVNDYRGRRLLMLDSTLQHSVVVADTTSATGKAYGSGLFGMVPFTGDSSLIQDRITDAFLVIAPTGKVARIIPPPSSNGRMSSFRDDMSGYDQAGHLMYREPLPIFLALLAPDFIGDTLMVGPDSLAMLREDLITRRTDTVAMLQAPRVRQAVTRRERGGSGRQAINPISAGDDWTLLNDGTLAVVRARDYHIDWIGPGRRVTAGPKVPTEWVRLSDSMKVAIMDSVRGPRRSDENASSGAPRLAYVEPSDLPDFRPPFTRGFTRADVEGNVWVRVNQPGEVYDVIDRRGIRLDRVRIPGDASLVGFGPGVAYLASNPRGTVHLAKARIH